MSLFTVRSVLYIYRITWDRQRTASDAETQGSLCLAMQYKTRIFPDRCNSACETVLTDP
jgi:hypothetical protein